MKMNYKSLFPDWLNSLQKFQIVAFFLIITIVGCSTKEVDNDESLINETSLCLVEINGAFSEIELDEVPKYLNGESEGFIEAIFENLIYPADARENSIEGLCVVNYEITKLGLVENIIAIQDPGGGIGNSTVETIQLATEGVSFSPAILNNNPVRVKKELEVKFKLHN